MDYDRIRQQYLLKNKSQREISKDLGISRNTVAKYCKGALIPVFVSATNAPIVSLRKQAISFITCYLAEDAADRNKKQPQSARRIYDRLVAEFGFTGAESTVRHVVHKLRGNLNEVYVPLRFDPGKVMQIDQGEADAVLGNTREHLYVFCARLAYSCAPFAVCFLKANTEAFLGGLCLTSSSLVVYRAVPFSTMPRQLSRAG